MQRLQQKSTWFGIAAILYAAYRAIVLKDFSEIVPAVSSGLGLVAVDA